MSEYDTFEQITHNGGITDHQIDGEEVSVAFKDQFGNEDYYDADQHLVLRTEENILDGKTLYDDSHNIVATETPNHEGGHTTYGPAHELIGRSIETPVGEMLLDSTGNTVSIDFDLGHGFHDVMHHSDPLLHVGDYVVPDLDLM